MHITILNKNTCKGMDQETKDWLKSCLQYEDVFWKQGRFKKEPQKYVKYLVDAQGRFLAGYIPKLVEIAKIQKKEIKWEGGELLSKTLYVATPNLPGITFREDQIRLIDNALDLSRGILKAPTRTGKTVIAAGVISALGSPKTLFLVHTKDLLEQTAEEYQKFEFDVGIMGGGFAHGWKRTITVATRQTFIKHVFDIEPDYFDLIIVDEAHHVIDFNGQYGKILLHLEPLVKLGFTATMPEKEKDRIILEGLIGPKIGEVTDEEAQEKGILAKTKVKLYKIPQDTSGALMESYAQAYRDLIVCKRSRNKLIVDIAKEYIDDDNTVLIIVRRVAHGFYLKDIFEKFYPNIEVPFLCGGIDSESVADIKRTKGQIKTLGIKYGSSYGKEKERVQNKIVKLEYYLKDLQDLKKKIQQNSEKRSEFKHKLNNREIKCIIATNIFNEGVNIPTLNTIILAGAGKSETQTIQSGSRAFTKSPGKEYGTLVDFFDPNHSTFVAHFGHRISMYFEVGWLG